MFFTCKEHYIGLEISILQEKPANKGIKNMINKMLQNPSVYRYILHLSNSKK